MNLLKRRFYTKEDYIKWMCILLVTGFLIVFLALPMITLFVKAFQDKNGGFVGLKHFADYFKNPALYTSVLNTIYIASASTIISVSLAFGFSYALSRKNVPFKSFFKYIAMLPIFAPTMLLGISLIYLFGNKGILTSIGINIELYGSLGIIIAESIYCFPVAMMLLLVAFSSADNRLYEAADTLGTSPLRKLTTITIPSIKYGLISAVFVCFTYSFTDFGAPSVVGGNYNVLATDVYKQVVGQQNFNVGAVVGMFLLLPAVISFVVDQIANKKQNAVSSKALPYVIKKKPKSDMLATVFCTVIAILIILFFLTSLFASLVKTWPYNLSLSFENYDFTKVASGDGVIAFRNSIVISLITAVIGTVITFITAYMIEKVKGVNKLRKVAYFLAKTPLAVPGTVIGLSFIMFFNTTEIDISKDFVLLNPLSSMYGTIWIIIIANIVHLFSVPFVTATTALKRLDSEFETVSDSLKVPFYTTLRKVTLPLCSVAIFEMVVYFFVNAMVTVSAVIFLYSPTVKIASVAIVNMQDAGDVAPAAAMSMLLLFINIIVRIVYEFISKKIKSKNRR